MKGLRSVTKTSEEEQATDDDVYFSFVGWRTLQILSAKS